MISSRHKFVYIHIPKTGGNSVHHALLPFSDDRMVVNGYKDGLDRFNIAGPITGKKHFSLSEYHATGMVDIASMTVIAGARHPFDRAVSDYFSAYRWAKKRDDGEWKIATPVWDETAFKAFVGNMAPMVYFLKVDGSVRQPDILLRQENLSEDFAGLVETLDLPIRPVLPVVNKSAASADKIAAVKRSAELRRFTEDHFRKDMDFFGY